MGSVENAILKTLAYSDCFNYPLSFKQIWQYLISDKTIKKKDIVDVLKKSKKVEKKDEYYFLKGKKEVVERRKEREKISIRKQLVARRFAGILSTIPTVNFIGISGSLAVHNASEIDDIDFFIISSPGTVWVTRFLSTSLLFLIGGKRKRVGKNHKNKICLNMYMDRLQIALPLKDRNLYTAHEIVQLQSVVNKNNTYELFLKENAWVLKYMPNSFNPKILNLLVEVNSSFTFLLPFETIAKRIQLWYMRKHLTSETVSDSYIAFHPRDMTEKVLNSYANKSRSYIL